ncbi:MULTISPECIES: two-component system sensor histidine kinase NtrB [Methylotenera]|uniref:two-component system sensor histidine kinase NtrB n=1 Tax=Methylotenera TaxID=359407 RepID=UPI00036838EF|nr:MULTISPECIES: ATP-binding protein [Methylotenera]
MVIELISNIDATITATRWRSLKLYNVYRLVIALMFLITQSTMSEGHLLQIGEKYLFSNLVLGYFIFSCISAILTSLEKPNIDFNLPAQIIIDIIFIVLLMHAQQDGVSGVGLLLIVTIASASLISEGRLALFYAALATIGILIEQTYLMLIIDREIQSYTGAVMLSLSCFATAWLAYSLAKRVQQSELLASQRGLDVKNLAQINALITHEMHDGVLVVDQNFQIKHHNMQARTLLGLYSNTDNSNADNWQENSLKDVSPDISKMLQNWMSETENTLENILPNMQPNIQANILKLNALSRELRLRFLPVSDNRQQGAVIFIEDWSQMQTQAHQVKLAALGRLTANIAHEIRNPLSAISHANQLLQEEDNDAATKRMLQIIGDNVQRVDQIIKDVLELNRRDRTNQEMIHLGNFITDFYTQFCAVEKIPPRCFKLELNALEKIQDTVISFDRRHLNQILWNLCKNGWRHSQQNENSLKLLVSIKIQTVQIEINDDGSGIPENVRSHLFEPFFTTEKSGTGLGLYIARELADANGAKLQHKTPTSLATSNIGTQFIIYIKKA